ncbi:MAG: hypothetical protein ACFFA0_15115 [Promethearchaeota archaeon]
MGIENINEDQLEKERLEKERLEKERLELERLEKERYEREKIEKQKEENKLYPNNSVFMIPSWSELLGHPTLGTYVHHSVSKIISDTVIFLSGYDYSIEVGRGTIHYLFGLGYYFLKFELESGKYITDNRILTGLVLSDFVYDHMATSGNVTLEEDKEVIIAEKVVKIPVDLSYKPEEHLTFIKGVVMRNIFIPYKDIFLELMERISKDYSYLIAKEGHKLLSTHWDSYNQILVSEKMRGIADTSYLNSTAGLYGIVFQADQLLKDTISSLNLSIIETNINSLKDIYSNIEFDPMYPFSIIEKASIMLQSGTPPITSKQQASITKRSKESLFASAEDRLYSFVSWPIQFKRKIKREPLAIPRGVEQPEYLKQSDNQISKITSLEIQDYKPEKFELETLKSEKVEVKTLPNPPVADIKQILLYLKNVIEQDYEMQSIGKAFEIARERMRQIGISSTTTQQKKIWEMSKYANIYMKKEPGFGLPQKEKQELLQKIDSWFFEIEEEERKERERLEAIRLEKERIEREEQERIRREKEERERIERERQEQIRREKERLEQEKLKRERLEKIEQEKQEKIRLERQRLEKEREEQEAIEKEKLELERLKQERKQKEREAKQEAKKRKKIEKQKKKIEKKKQKEQKKLGKL